MATTVGSHSVSAFATPVNGGPLDANVVRGNDNTIRTAYVAHDADTGIHVQSSSLASRPAAGTAGRKWITVDTGSYKLWYDDGTTWHEVATATIDVFVIADENLVKGDVVKVTGYNNGAGAPRVAKVSSAADVAFGIINGTIANGATGYLTNTGIIADVATNAFSVGDILYPSTSGGFTATKPTSGNYQPAAYVLRSNANNGVLYVEFSAPRIVERSDNTASTVVLRDASGNFAAGTITAGALTSTGLVTFASLKGTGATTVTNILDEDNMASDSATALATQQSIKAYVDAKVATVDTLAEVLANGNTTGANNIIVTAGQKITTNTIDETTSGSGVTIDSVLLKDDVVNATDIETGTVSANDGTLAITIANSTGALTLNTALADSNLATIATAGKVSNSATTATNANTASAIVARDASGNFTAGTITANLTGNISGTAPAGTLTGTTLASNVVSSSLTSVGTLASLTVTNPISGSVTGSSGSTTGNAATATALQTARNINGVSFNGTADITVTAAAGTLSGSTLASGVTASSLTSVGTLTSLTVSGTITSENSIRVNKDGSDTAADGAFVGIRNAAATRQWLTQLGASNTYDWWYYNGSSWTKYATFDASGNVGIGVTPSAWGRGKALEVGSIGNALWGDGSTNGIVSVSANAYLSTANTTTGWKYAYTGPAGRYSISENVHSWLNAASGTAGTAITFTQAMTLDASGNLLVGTTSSLFNSAGRGVIEINGSSQAILGLETGATNRMYLQTIGTNNYIVSNALPLQIEATGSNIINFATNSTERARITSGGDFLVKMTATSDSSTGAYIAVSGQGYHGVEGGTPLICNRKTDDGTLVAFYQDSATEGTISVSGNTVSYNAFAGSHWSQLEDGSKPEILRGTVMEALNELCEWPNESNERLPKAKVSDTAGSKKVYGVFMGWDNDWTATNDMYVTSLGAFVCRVSADIVVEQGDLLESNGDGTARVQADDVIRSSTIGKVTSTVKTHEYEDGTYCVPTVLYCG
jgi:hypothetical protein